MAAKTVITSFSARGWTEYAKRGIDSFVDRWPLKHGELELVVYHEPGQPDVYRHRDRGVTWLPIDTVPDLTAFLAAVSFFPLMRGEVGEGQYSVQPDARHCRKTLMQCHAVKTYGGKVFWLDADVVTHADVPPDFLDEMLPDDKLACHLGRANFYTESGFIGFNADHPLAESFMAHYRAIVTSGSIFTQRAWHDCIAFDWAKALFAQQGHGDAFVDLGAGVDPGPGLQVFSNHPRLSAYCDHLKGNRKGLTRSPDSDFTAPHEGAHWQQPVEKVEGDAA